MLSFGRLEVYLKKKIERFLPSQERLHVLYPNLMDSWWRRGYENGMLACQRLHGKDVKMPGDEKKHLESTIRNLKLNLASVQKELNLLKEKHERKRREPRHFKENRLKRKDPRFKQERHRRTMLGICIYCGEEAESIDHLTPRSRGGSDASDNKALACIRCNQEKGNMTYDEYIIWRKFHKPF